MHRVGRSSSTESSSHHGFRAWFREWRDTFRSLPFELMLLALSFLWLLLGILYVELPGPYAPSDVSSIAQTLATLTFEAAFAVPIGVIVAVVGAAMALRRGYSAENAEFVNRLRRLIRAAAWVTTFVLISIPFSIVVAAVRLSAGLSDQIGVALAVASLVLTGVVVDIALLYAILMELARAPASE